MAEQGVLLDQDQFCCSVCLDLLKDPVTLPCGHSYCSGCIKDYWDQDEQRGIYSCPQCRRSFTPRPALMRNNMLAEVVEKLKETGGAQAAPSELTSPAGSELVPCDLCTGTRKQSAVMSCVVCLVSYCETHLQPHYQVPVLKRHKLVKATSGLQERICSRHDKLLEVFCRTDQQCICYLCVMDEHKGHDTVSATAERAEKQSKLVLSRQKVQQRVQEREKQVKELQQAVESVKHSGQAAEQDTERIFTELICSIERRRSEVKELIRGQQGAAVSETEGVVERLEQEIAELRRRDVELEQLSHTDDHIHFLQSYQSVSSPSVSSDLSSISVPSLQYFSDVTKSVSDLREKLEDVIKGEWSHMIKGEWSNISFRGCVGYLRKLFYKNITKVRRATSDPIPSNKKQCDQRKHIEHLYTPYFALKCMILCVFVCVCACVSVSLVDVLSPPEPRTRADFLHYSCPLTLDPNTASSDLSLSEENRKVTYLNQIQSYPDHPDRFTKYVQVLCREALSGRCYWEVEWRGEGVNIAVSYKDISRTVSSSLFGNSNKSWKLRCSSGGYSFMHNKVLTKISGPRSSRVGVYLDHKAGSLSFYSVSETDSVTLLHRVQTTFTQPLYPGFGLYYFNACSEIIKLW